MIRKVPINNSSNCMTWFLVSKNKHAKTSLVWAHVRIGKNCLASLRLVSRPSRCQDSSKNLRTISKQACNCTNLACPSPLAWQNVVRSAAVSSHKLPNSFNKSRGKSTADSPFTPSMQQDRSLNTQRLTKTPSHALVSAHGAVPTLANLKLPHIGGPISVIC